jgi:hypothetical protein
MPPHVIRSEIVEIGKQFLLACTLRDRFDNIGDTHARALDARSPAANGRVGANSSKQVVCVHGRRLPSIAG